MIQTLNKKINKKEVNGKFNFAHEHLNFDLTHIRKDKDSKIKNNNLILDELKEEVKKGLGLIVDLSNQSMNSDKKQLLDISKNLNIPIVCATGYYLNEYELNNKKTLDKIVEEFKNHILKGFSNSTIKAGIIGEIATGNEISNFEKMIFEAAIIVQKELGCPIYTHINLGAMALKQLDLLIKHEAIPAKTIIGHVDFLEWKVISEMLKRGFVIGIDTIGKINYLKDEKRIELLEKIMIEGYEDRVVLSLDISRKSYLKKQGGHGYMHLQNDFYKKIKNKITPKQWNKIAFENILNVLDF